MSSRFQVPPVRERREDIAVLVERFNQRFSADYGKSRRPPTLTAREAKIPRGDRSDKVDYYDAVLSVRTFLRPQVADRSDFASVGFADRVAVPFQFLLLHQVVMIGLGDDEIIVISDWSSRTLPVLPELDSSRFLVIRFAHKQPFTLP